MTTIRNYQKTDYSQVASILKEAGLFDDVWDSQENLSGMIDKDPEAIIVAQQDNCVVGNLLIIPYGKKISYLFRLAVKKEYRKQGIATALIKHAKEIADKRGISEIGLYVESDNQDLQTYYMNRGFKISPKSYRYMWKDLN